MKRKLQWPLIVGLIATGVAVGRWVGPAQLQGQSASPAADHPRELTSYRDVVKQVLPAVVSIEPRIKAKRAQQARQQAPMLPEGIPDEFRRFFEDQGGRFQVPVPQNPVLGFGSGFIVDPSGIIMTNWHVVDGADSVTVKLSDGRTFTSSDIKSDKNSDIAIIRVATDSPLPYLKFGDSSQMEVGDRVLAVGAPFGLTGSVTHGIISAKGRALENPRYDDFLQTDAAVNPGNSGGPLVNLAGEVIGINSAIKSRSGGFQGVAMSISGNMAKSVMQQLLKDGVVKRGYLGIEMARELTPEVADRLGLRNGGVVVVNVLENSPAAKAGIQVDDAIVGIDGKPVRENRELQRTVANLPLGKAVAVDIIRESKPMQLTLTLEPQPSQFDEARRIPVRQGGGKQVEVVAVPKAGLELADLTEDRAQALGLTRKAGALVATVDPSGPAAEAGVQQGMVIVRVDKKPVANAEQAKAALEAANPEKGALVQMESPQGGVAFAIVKPQK